MIEWTFTFDNNGDLSSMTQFVNDFLMPNILKHS